jgi:hypothetical protein
MNVVKKATVNGVVSFGIGFQLASGESEDHIHSDLMVPRPFEVFQNCLSAVTAPAPGDFPAASCQGVTE